MGSLKPDSRFFPALEASRGVAALMVALLHAGQATYLDASGQSATLMGPSSSILFHVIGNGHGAVIFFFVLSGFVLTLVLQNGPQSPATAGWQFLVGRIFRIFPAILTTLALFVFVFLMTGVGFASPDSYTPANILLNAVLIRTDINGVMWSLQSEMIAAPLIAVSYFLARRWGVLFLVILAAVLMALSVIKSWSLLSGDQDSLGPIHAFIAGMIACLVGQSRQGKRKSVNWLLVGIVGFAGARPVFGWSSNGAILAETGFAAIVVAELAYGDIEWRLVRPVARLLTFYGRISYSFYLLHPLTLFVIWNMRSPLTHALASGWPPAVLAVGLFIGSTVAITPLAWLQQRVVERSGIAMGRRVMRPWLLRVPAAKSRC